MLNWFAIHIPYLMRHLFKSLAHFLGGRLFSYHSALRALQSSGHKPFIRNYLQIFSPIPLTCLFILLTMFFKEVFNILEFQLTHFFPLINCDEGLKKVDEYLQYYLRYLSTGRHNKANYRLRYKDLKENNYKSLVNEYYKFKNTITGITRNK